MAAAPANDFVGQGRDGKHQGHLDQDLNHIVDQTGFGQGRHQGKEDGEDHQADQEHHQDEGGAAAGVAGAVAAGVVQIQRFAGFVGADGLVFGTVVLEHPADFFKEGYAPDIKKNKGSGYVKKRRRKIKSNKRCNNRP